MNSIHRFALAVIALALTAGGRAEASLLTYVSESLTAPGLYDFDTTTGASTLRVAFPSRSPRIFALDTRPSDGAVFGGTVSGDLISLNVNTGAITTLSHIGSQIDGLAFGPDNTLYLELVTGNNQGPFTWSLNRFDLATNTLTFIANTGFAAAPSQLTGMTGALSFSPSGVLYGFNKGGDLAAGAFYSINPVTGVTTLIGPAGQFPFKTLEDAAFGSDGQLYVTDYNLGQISRVNTTTGIRTSVGSVPGNEATGLIAFPGPLPAPVPEPATIGMALTASVAGLVAYRRRKRSA